MSILSSSSSTKSFIDLQRAECWIFDLDNTLYPMASNLFPQVEQRMSQFIQERFNLSYEQAYDKQKEYFDGYGTTLRGLMVHDGVEPLDFLDFVHDIDYSILSYDGVMDDALGGLSGRKIIFTNGSESHAHNVLRELGLAGHFEAIFDIVAADFTPKPHVEPYRALLSKHDIVPERAVMVEDIAKNLHCPYDLGMATLWVENDHEWCQTPHSHMIHFQTSDLAQFLKSITEV